MFIVFYKVYFKSKLLLEVCVQPLLVAGNSTLAEQAATDDRGSSFSTRCISRVNCCWRCVQPLLGSEIVGNSTLVEQAASSDKGSSSSTRCISNCYLPVMYHQPLLVNESERG